MLRSVAIALDVGILTVSVGPASLALQPFVVYSNCSELLKDYPNGVAKSPRAANLAVENGNKRPAVSRKVYKENVKSDRDRDEVACEQSA